MAQIRTTVVTGYSRGFKGNLSKEDSDADYGISKVSGVEVKDHKSFPIATLKHINSYLVTRIVSPFEFYLRLEPEHRSDINVPFDEKEMQHEYDALENQPRMFKIFVEIMKCYAYRDPESRKWCRVRLHALETDGNSTRAMVHFCDTGKQGFINCQDLRQLNPKFFGSSGSPLLKCYLYDILPVSEGEGGEFAWPINAILFFRGFLKQQRCQAVVMHHSSENVVPGSPQTVMDCGVILTVKKRVVSEITVNQFMVKKGYARTIGFTASISSILFLPGKEPHFEYDITRHDHCKNQSHEISLQQLREIAKRVVQESSYRPDFCHFCFSDRGRYPSYFKNPENYFSEMMRRRLAWVNISFLEGPHKIFVQMQSKLMELAEMEREISLEVCKSNGEPISSELSKALCPGTFVSCEIKDAQRENAARRGLVLRVDAKTELARILFVDYGTIAWIPKIMLSILPQRFRTIPPFTHRVHLCNVRPNFGATTWDSHVSSVFTKYVIAHDPYNPIYFVHLPEGKGKIQFTHFRQTICFDDICQDWKADEAELPSKDDGNLYYDVIDSMKDDPLLASYFSSFGVELSYEVHVDPTKLWEFDYLEDYLVEWGHGLLVEKRVDKQKIHEVIVEDCGTL